MLQGFDEWLLRGAEEALGEDNKCTCGRDDLETGNLGEPAEHDDGCPIWEEAKIEQIARDEADKARRIILGLCVECGNALDKFSLDGDYEQCEPCSIVDVYEYFETLEAGEVK